MIRRLLGGLGLAALLAGPALASPEGLWEIEMRDSRYKVTLCGDGTELCAQLIWLGNGADNAENLPYLNTFLIERARPVAPGRWEGTLQLYGQRAAGTIVQDSADQMTLTGCVLVIACKSYKMFRY